MLRFFIRKRINLTLDSEVLARAKNKGSRNENVEVDEWILKKILLLENLRVLI